MSKHSRHIKQDAIKKIISQDLSCESRMNEIREMVGMPPVIDEVNANEKGVVEEIRNEEEVNSDQGIPTQGSLMEDSISRLVEGLSGRELSTAKNLINELMKTSDISWDANSLEMKINGKLISYSNMNLLISKVVSSSSPSIPLGLVNFIFYMINSKIPLSYQKDGDTRNIRNALIEILKIETGSTSFEESNSNEKGLKRTREEETDESVSEDQLSKKLKNDTSDDLIENIDLNKNSNDGRRRSSRLRLKKDLRNSWRELDS